MPRGTEHTASKRASKHKASPMLVDYIQAGPTTATEEWAVGYRPEKGGKKDHGSEMKKKLEQWDQQYKKASS